MLKKILIGVGSFIALLLAAAFILPILYKGKIETMVKEEINKSIHAKVDFTSYDLTIFKSFPNLSIELNGLSVVNQEPFAGDTLAGMKQLSLTIDIMSVIGGGQIDIKSVQLKEPRIHLIVLKDGKANWDIAKEDSSKSEASSEPSKFKVALRSYSISDGMLSYEDASMDFNMLMEDLNHTGKGDFTQDLFVLSTQTDIASADLWFGGVKYLHRVKTGLKVDLDIDMPNMKFTFKENEIALNELILGVDGWVAMPTDDITMDMKFDARKNEFKNFVSMVPGVYKEGFKDLKSSGTLSLKAFVKGTYNEKQMPGFGLNLKVQNGNFQYPSLPVAVNNVQLNLNVNNADGVPDHTIIDLQQLHVELGNQPFDAKLSVRTPVSDAEIKGSIKGDVNFANISKVVPLEEGTTMKGTLKANVNINGRMSAIEQERYEDFQADGLIQLNNFKYGTKGNEQSYDLNEVKLTFNPQFVELNNFDAMLGKSDVRANGRLDNLLAFVIKNETLKGNLNVNSRLLDLVAMNGGSSSSTTTAATDTTPMSIIEVPGNLDFTTNLTVIKLLYDNLVLDNVNGKVVIRNQAINMENLSFNTLSGSMKMSGSYATPERKSANIAFDMNISGFDIQQTVNAFESVKKMAPIAEKTTGKYSTTLSIKTKLNEHMEPNLSTMSGGGKLSTESVVINSFSPLLKVAETLKLDQFKQLPVKNINFSYTLENGRAVVKPFDVNLVGIPTTVQGSTGFDQTIDYTLAMNIPTSKLPGAASSAIGGLITSSNAKGANLSMSENVKLNLLMGGTVTKPTVSTDLKETTGNIINAAKDKVKEEINQKKEELENKAKAEADRLKKEAEAKANAEKERLKKEAEDKIKAEKERLKKEAEKKAKDAVRGLFK
jgi:AsmA-like C-terminal region/AsmA family